MAKLFLDANETYIVSSNTVVYGGTGNETILINGTPTVTVQSTVERVELTGNLSTYSFAVQGNQVTVKSGTTTVATITVPDTSTGQTLAFADGSAALKITGLNAATLGAAAVPTTSAPVAATLNTGDTSTVSGGTVGSISANGSSDASTGNKVYTFAAGTYTYNITGLGAGDVLDFPEGNAASVANSDYADGVVDLNWSSGSNTVTVHLTGISNANDALLNSAADFNTVFGAGTLI